MIVVVVFTKIVPSLHRWENSTSPLFTMFVFIDAIVNHFARQLLCTVQCQTGEDVFFISLPSSVSRTKKTPIQTTCFVFQNHFSYSDFSFYVALASIEQSGHLPKWKPTGLSNRVSSTYF